MIKFGQPGTICTLVSNQPLPLIFARLKPISDGFARRWGMAFQLSASLHRSSLASGVSFPTMIINWDKDAAVGE